MLGAPLEQQVQALGTCIPVYRLLSGAALGFGSPLPD